MKVILLIHLGANGDCVMKTTGLCVELPVAPRICEFGQRFHILHHFPDGQVT